MLLVGKNIVSILHLWANYFRKLLKFDDDTLKRVEYILGCSPKSVLFADPLCLHDSLVEKKVPSEPVFSIDLFCLIVPQIRA